MRIYELAKEAGVSSADVIKAAEAAGVEATNAISVVEGGDVEKLRQAVASVDKSSVAAGRERKKARSCELRRQLRESDRSALERHLKIARDAAEGSRVETAVSAPAAPAPAAPEKSAPPAPAPDKAPAAGKPVIRMAPGHKPKAAAPVPPREVKLEHRNHPGFKPLQKAACLCSTTPPPFKTT